MPPAVAAAGVAAAGTIGAAGVQAATAGGGGQTGYSLPPEFEIGLINQTQTQLDQVNKDYQTNQQLLTAYNERLDTLDKYLKGGLPAQATIEKLTQTSGKIAQAFGNDAEALAKSGFVDPYVRQQLDALSNANSEKNNPELENTFADQRAQLAQGLLRSGASGAAIQGQMALLARQQQEQRFNENLGLAQFRLGAYSQSQQEGFNRAIGGYNALQTEFNKYGQIVGALGQTAGNRLNAGQQTLQTGSALRGENRDIYKNLGSYVLSDSTRAELQSGLIGPGSLYQQTGISGDFLGAYRDSVAEQENSVSNDALLSRIQNMDLSKGLDVPGIIRGMDSRQRAAFNYRNASYSNGVRPSAQPYTRYSDYNTAIGNRG